MSGGASAGFRSRVVLGVLRNGVLSACSNRGGRYNTDNCRGSDDAGSNIVCVCCVRAITVMVDGGVVLFFSWN